LAAGLRLPGPVDPDRLLALELEPGAMEGVRGLVEKWQGGNAARDEDDLTAGSGGS